MGSPTFFYHLFQHVLLLFGKPGYLVVPLFGKRVKAERAVRRVLVNVKILIQIPDVAHVKEIRVHRQKAVVKRDAVKDQLAVIVPAVVLARAHLGGQNARQQNALWVV